MKKVLVQSPLLIISVAAVFYSCHFHASTLSTHSPLNSDSTSMGAGPSANNFKARLTIQDHGRSLTVARINRESCAQSQGRILEIEIPFRSVLGSHILKAQLSLHESQTPTLLAQLEHVEFALDSSQLAQASEITSICDLASSNPELPLTPTWDQHINNWLSRAVPDCSFSPDTLEGFWCELPTVDPLSAQETLSDIKRTMVRSWSRQPYILTRRVSLAKSLAQSLASNEINPSLDRLCRVIAHSDPVELPLSLSNRRWQDAVCFQHSNYRIEAAQHGLQKAIGEIEFLRQLFERTSKLGTLSVRIPRESVPTRDLWIYLSPGPDVTATLTQESEVISAKLSNLEAEEFATAKSCWHPLFATDQYTFEIARRLDLTGEANKIKCLSSHAAKSLPAISPSIYLAESITSETEFVVTNGRSKMLRLPAGTYSYEIKGYYETRDQESAPDSSLGTGQIFWPSRRPSASIRTL